VRLILQSIVVRLVNRIADGRKSAFRSGGFVIRSVFLCLRMFLSANPQPFRHNMRYASTLTMFRVAADFTTASNAAMPCSTSASGTG